MNDISTVNKVFLVGQISRTPRWHKKGAEDAALCFTVTTLEMHRQQNKLIEHVEQHAVKLEEKRFERELKLGQTVHVEGKLKTTAFLEDGIRRYKTEVVAMRVTPV
ncbi:single-stranded DNA-binding protein [Mucilaginibacter roseus]|uniref:Single-stranded DNA-binding protein n=1 Tax=Mucilaginibacter roseus TaxID=1528868 RepID=A0ABS8TW57_9SPHI|nr:single-stranded DNA-binding protein [Mucilaginibacter roseus]MCD8739121.1 single-stranded DNA-binding protein [Mucilaginibacter roseus]